MPHKIPHMIRTWVLVPKIQKIQKVSIICMQKRAGQIKPVTKPPSYFLHIFISQKQFIKQVQSKDIVNNPFLKRFWAFHKEFRIFL